MIRNMRSLNRKYFSTATKIPECSFIPQKYTGLPLDDLLKIRKTNLSPALTTFYSKPIAFNQGYKQWLYDLDGKRYLDMFGGICTVSVGHAHPKVTEAAMKQLQTLGHISNVYVHPKIHEFAEKLASKMPGNLKVIYFVNSGSEANDLAALMAKAYTGNNDIISLKNSYHGLVSQIMSLTSNTHYKFADNVAVGTHNVMNPDPFTGLWGGSKCRDSPIQTSRKCSCQESNCEAKDKYIEQFEDMFKYNVRPGKLAAFFVESIQGVGGTVQFPKGYLKEVEAIVKKNGGVLISDEVQTGFGRTGDHFWGFEMHGIQPDIVTMAKGIGNGFPLAAVVTTPEVAAAMTKASHINTFGGNPVSCAVGLSVLEIIKEEKLQENSKEVGTYLLLEYEKLKSEFPVVGDVRGKGLMIGVELVCGDGTRKPLTADRFMKMWEYCKEAGVIFGRGGYHGNVLRMKPPMCITKKDADFSVQILKQGLRQIS